MHLKQSPADHDATGCISMCMLLLAVQFSCVWCIKCCPCLLTIAPSSHAHMLVASWLMYTTVVIPQDACWEADDHIIHANATKGLRLWL